MDINVSYGTLWGGSDVKHQGVCPAGWHLPNSAEWQTLVDFVGGKETAGKKLKSTSGWSDYKGDSGNGTDGYSGTDEYGFSALPGGYYSVGSFTDVGQRGWWWSATEFHDYTALDRIINYSEESVNVYGHDYNKYHLVSVRCVQN